MSSLTFYCLKVLISAIYEKWVTDRRTVQWTDRRTNGQTDGPMDGRTDGRTKPLIEMRGRI